jgi:hypothetical protein
MENNPQIEKIERRTPAERLWAELEDTERLSKAPRKKPAPLNYYDELLAREIVTALLGDSK